MNGEQHHSEGDAAPPVNLEQFLAQVERRAYRTALLATRNRDDALDIVQDAMFSLARSYGARPGQEWPPLFYRILQNSIRDWQRRGKFRRLFFGLWDDRNEREMELPCPAPGVGARLEADQALQALEAALADLPYRQQQVFLLRVWEGLDVADTARAMGCATGSVKTHFSRAVQALRARLGDHWS